MLHAQKQKNRHESRLLQIGFSNYLLFVNKSLVQIIKPSSTNSFFLSCNFQIPHSRASSYVSVTASRAAPAARTCMNDSRIFLISELHETLF